MKSKTDIQKLFKSVKYLTNLIIVLVLAVILTPIIMLNSEKIGDLLFGDEGKVVSIEEISLSQTTRSNAQNYFKSISWAPKENFSQDKINLGQKLYHDTRLSQDGNISCNSCHNLNTYGVDNLPTSPGDLGEFGDRNSPTVIYASLHANQFWDGRAKDVEEQAGMPILNPVEHNIPSEEFLVNRIKEISEYQTLFKLAFPNEQQPISYANLTKAIGAFERQLTPKSKFDEWLDGDDSAISEEALKGINVFIDNGCVACHSGIALGGQMMQKFGVYGNYWEFTNSKNIDKGLYEITGNEMDKYVFKVPSLRNITKTYPYFHDGSVEDLSEAIKIMNRLQNNKYLNDRATNQIIAFLETLTAEIPDRFKQ